MRELRFAMICLLLLAAACDPLPVQYPPGYPAPYPSGYPTIPAPSQQSGSSFPTGSNPPPSPQPQPQVTGSQRLQHGMSKAMEGVALGGAIGGPIGAGAGFVVFGLFGLITADDHYAQLNAQISSEHAKDKELEAQIEQEILRQRELESQLGKVGTPQGPIKKEEVQVAQKPQPREPTVERKTERKEEPNSLASLGRREIPPPPSTPFRNVEIKDINGDGIPDLWIYYHPLKPGEIVRQEEDTNGDGRVDTWSYFNDGKLVRREVDTKGAGRPDIIYYYENDRIAREEQYETGDGRVSFRAIYQNGRLAKLEKDLDRDGKIDLWVYYDPAKDEEVVLKEERDLNGDGAVDLWSYYESGRLVRRDVSVVGLEYLMKQEKHPSEASPQAPPRS